MICCRYLDIVGITFTLSRLLSFALKMFSEVYLIFTSFLVLKVHTILGQMNSNNFGSTMQCKFQANGYDCGRNNTPDARFYYDIKMESCKTFTYNHCEMTRNHFTSLTECNELCRDSSRLPISDQNMTAEVYCLLQPDFGDCSAYFPMWYFDVTGRGCRGFSYSGCGGNSNRFATLQKCNLICGQAVRYPKEPGLDKFS